MLCIPVMSHLYRGRVTLVPPPVPQVHADVRTIMTRVYYTVYSLRFPRIHRVRYDLNALSVRAY